MGGTGQKSQNKCGNLELTSIPYIVMAVFSTKRCFLCSLITMTLTGLIFCVIAGVMNKELQTLNPDLPQISNEGTDAGNKNPDEVISIQLIKRLAQYFGTCGSLQTISGILGLIATGFIICKNISRLVLIKAILILVVGSTTTQVVLLGYSGYGYGRLHEILRTDLLQLVRDYDGRFDHQSMADPIRYQRPSNPNTLTLDVMHLKYRCCGVNGGSDFDAENLKWNTSRILVFADGASKFLHFPPTCCKYDDMNVKKWLKTLKEKGFTYMYRTADTVMNCISPSTNAVGCYDVVDKKAQSWAQAILFFYLLGTSSQIGCLISGCLWIGLRKDKSVPARLPPKAARRDADGQPMVNTTEE